MLPSEALSRFELEAALARGTELRMFSPSSSSGDSCDSTADDPDAFLSRSPVALGNPSGMVRTAIRESKCPPFGAAGGVLDGFRANGCQIGEDSSIQNLYICPAYSHFLFRFHSWMAAVSSDLLGHLRRSRT